MKSDWKDAADHRKPQWPLMGYAPGDYTGRCIICNQQFMNMDKRAYHCLPCAVEAANERAKATVEALQFERAKTATLTAALQIVDRTALDQHHD